MHAARKFIAILALVALGGSRPRASAWPAAGENPPAAQKEGPGASFVSQSVPPTARTEEPVAVTIVMKNSGTVAWDSTYFLVSIAMPWSAPRTRLADGETVPPGATRSFSFTVTAPAKAGVYPFQCQLVSRRGRIGEPSPELLVKVEPRESGNDARFVSQSIPKRLARGGEYPATIAMKNTGTTTWTRKGGYALKFDGSVKSQDGGPDSVNLDPADSVAPGQTRAFSFFLAGTGDRVRGRWRMGQEGKPDFGETSNAVDIAAAKLRGTLDLAGCRSIDGWAADASDHSQRVRVAILADGAQFALVTADVFRPDLAEAREGRGRNGFSLATPGFLKDGNPHSISAVIVPSGGFHLNGSPKSITCEAPAKRRRE